MVIGIAFAPWAPPRNPFSFPGANWQADVLQKGYYTQHTVLILNCLLELSSY